MNPITPIADLVSAPQLNNEAYLSEYFEFMNKYRIAEISAEEVGQMLARLAQYYSLFNLQVTSAERKLSLVAQDVESRVDDNGKAISSTKAKVFVDATPEAETVSILKAHRDNVDVFISSLRSLQKGLLTEFSHTSVS